ncbi:MAG: ABC transporter permease [Planctomycetota bacterium]
MPQRMTTLAVPTSSADANADGPAASASGAERIVTVIEPRRGWIGVDWGELWRYRELLYFLVWRDLKVKYKMAILGMAWAVFVPIVSMLVYGGVGATLNLDEAVTAPYFLWMYAGLLPWLFIQRNLSDGGMALVNQQPLLTKIYLPRVFLPAASCGSGLVDLGINFILFALLGVGFAVFTDWTPTWHIVFALPLLAITVMLALGISLTFSALTVLYRDLRFLVPFAVQFGLWLSAVPYPLSDERFDGIRAWYAINPVTGIVAAWRSVLVGAEMHWLHFGTSVVGAVALLLFGLFYFKRVERRFADIA